MDSSQLTYSNLQIVESTKNIVNSLHFTGFLKESFKSTLPIERVKSCIAVVQLIRDEVRQCRMFVDYKPVVFLIDHLKEILLSDDFETTQQQTTYKNGPKLFYQIISALSTIIPSRSLTAPISSCNSSYKMQFGCDTGCALRLLKESESPPTALITFVNTDNESIDAIPKEQLTEGSEYFRGMFSNAFVEQSTGRDTFTFREDDENCTQSEYRQFLHYLYGCRSSECFTIRNAHDVVTMLQLADRYLCSSLTDMLLSSDGPAMYYIDGETLPEFLNASLCAGAGATQRLKDACICVLMRYSTEDEVLRALRQLAGDESAVNAFVQQLALFMQNYIIKNRYM